MTCPDMTESETEFGDNGTVCSVKHRAPYGARNKKGVLP